jgi:hypothetical protein
VAQSAGANCVPLVGLIHHPDGSNHPQGFLHTSGSVDVEGSSDDDGGDGIALVKGNTDSLDQPKVSTAKVQTGNDGKLCRCVSGIYSSSSTIFLPWSDLEVKFSTKVYILQAEAFSFHGQI